MSDFRMPSLGAEMEAGRLIEWRIKPGDAVKRGMIVAVVDTDKAAVEVEIWEDGVVEELLVPPGQKVPVGTSLARIRAKGEAARAPEAAAEGGPALPPPPTPAQAARPVPAPAPPPVRVAERVVGPGVPARISPAARRAAIELGVDLAEVRGTGPNGAVTSADVERAAGEHGGLTAAATASAGAGAPPEEVRKQAMRATIAAAMARSKREIPHYYLGTPIDLGRSLEWLAAENARRSVADRILYSALLLKAVAKALERVPELNGFWREGRHSPSQAIHPGVAISLRGGGLIAPALHDAGKKSLGDVMREMSDLVARARAGSLRSSELADATITVTNLGEQGVEEVFGVIYPPQVALVGFGKVMQVPRVVDGAIAARPVIRASLSADHRVTDGHRGAVFLSHLERMLQGPETLC